MAWPTCLQTAHVRAGAAGTYADIQGEAGGGMKEEEDGGVN